MKKLKGIAILITCLMFSHAFAGRLDNGALEQINNSAAFGVTGLNLKYWETFLPSDDTSKNGVPPKSTEAGTIIGFYFNPRMSFNEKIYTDLYLDYYNGKLKYDGTGQDPAKPLGYHKPIVDNFWHKFVNADFKTGYIFTFTENHSFQAIPYVGVGYRYWYRMHNNLWIQEKYQHYKAVVGIKFNWLLNEDFILSPYVEGGQIFNAQMKFCGNDPVRPSMHGLKFKLGNKPVYTGGLELNYKIFDEFFLNGFVSYTQFKYGRSAPQPINGSLEPDSKTNELKAGLGVRYSWLIN